MLDVVYRRRYRVRKEEERKEMRKGRIYNDRHSKKGNTREKRKDKETGIKKIP